MDNNNDEGNAPNENDKKSTDEVSKAANDMNENKKLREIIMQELLRELYKIKGSKDVENPANLTIEELIKQEMQNQLYNIKDTKTDIEADTDLDTDTKEQMIGIIIAELIDEALELNEKLDLDTSNEVEEQMGEFIKHDLLEELLEKVPEENKTETKLRSESPWYEEYETTYRFGDAKQVGSEYYDLAWDFGVDNDVKDKDDFIGDFLKLNLSDDTITPKNNSDLNVSKLENVFKTSPMLSLNNKLDLENPKYEPNVKETPIVSDIELDYDNLYENVENASEMEKHLQLLYRPFTCLVDVNCRLRLYELSILLDDALYEPEYHPALCVRLRNPSAELKIYAGGKITATAITASSARIALLKMIRTIEELNYKTDISNFSKNIVHASFCMPFKIDLELLCEMHSDQVCCNRETRPFITYKVEGTSIRFAVFENGYVLVLHSSQHSETRAAIAGFLPILSHFRNGYLTESEKNGTLLGDVSFRLLWERKLEEDKEGLLLYS